MHMEMSICTGHELDACTWIKAEHKYHLIWKYSFVPEITFISSITTKETAKKLLQNGQRIQCSLWICR